MTLLATTFLLFTVGVAEEDASVLLKKASAAAGEQKFAQAADLVTAAIKKADKPEPYLYYVRGRYRFQAAQIKQSLEDFDRYVKLVPAQASRQWERGITCYYAKAFRKGAAQFELYQTYHANDVENSVWRFLCMVPTDGVKKSRKVMLPIKNDRRLAMMKVYEMYRGNVKPADVLTAIRDAPKDVVSGEARQAGTFYAYLYIGLYEEVLGHKAEARKYIEKAADKKYRNNGRVNTYMWEVARIHHERMRKSKTKPSGSKDAAGKKRSK